MNSNIMGVILAGGQSRRFGRNKAFETVDGERLIDRNVRLLGKHFPSVMIITIASFAHYIDLPVTLIRDIVSIPGPLTGIYTALLFSQRDWIFVRAVDMPFLENSLVKFLVNAISDNIDVVIPVTDRGHEPLCALYRRTCVRHIANVLESGGGRIIDFFPHIRVLEIPPEVWHVPDPKGISFYNINTPADLMELLNGGLF